MARRSAPRGLGSGFESCRCRASRDEEWMRTDIRLFKLDRFGLPDATAYRRLPIALPHALLADGVELGGRAVDAWTAMRVARELDESGRDRACCSAAWTSWLREHGDLLRPYFERRVVDPYSDKFAALQCGLLVGRHAAVRAARRDDRRAAALALGDDRRRRRLGQDAGDSRRRRRSDAAAETASATPKRGGLHCGAIELIVEPGARLRYVNLQNWGQRRLALRPSEGAASSATGRLQWTIGALGSRLAKVNQHVALTGAEPRCRSTA